MNKELSGVILDVDGTLVDSNTAHARAWWDVLTEAGYQVTVAGLRQLIGMGSDRLLPRACGLALDTPKGQQLSERCKEVFRARYLPDLQPTRGARQLLDRLRSDGLKLAVASSAEQNELRALLDVVGAAVLIEHAASSSELAASKPAPDIVEAALVKLGCPAAEAIMLGDTPYDVEAATGAGVAVIALRCGGWADDELVGATAIWDDPADFLTHYARRRPATSRSHAPGHIEACRHCRGSDDLDRRDSGTQQRP
jgi:HAD superfamily hydrolase (TIGR01509 family)